MDEVTELTLTCVREFLSRQVSGKNTDRIVECYINRCFQPESVVLCFPKVT